MVAVRPGGRGLPTVILDLLRFALSPKRYEGEVTALLNPPVATPPKPKSQKKKGRRRLWRFPAEGTPLQVPEPPPGRDGSPDLHRAVCGPLPLDRRAAPTPNGSSSRRGGCGATRPS